MRSRVPPKTGTRYCMSTTPSSGVWMDPEDPETQSGYSKSMASLSSSSASALVPPIQYMVACENVNFDVAQNLTLVGIFDSLNAPAFPTVTPIFYIVFGLHNAFSGVYRTQIVIEHSDGTVVLEQAMNDTIVTSQQKNARILLRLQGVAWQRPGDYVVKLKLRGEVAGAFTIRLAQMALPGFSANFNPPPGSPPTL